MRVTDELVLNAWETLGVKERERVFSSDSRADARTAVTKFSTRLVALAAAQVYPSFKHNLTVHAAFKGNKSGQTGGGAGGLLALGVFAQSAIESAGLKYRDSEHLVDYMVVKEDLFDVFLSAESEARPLAHGVDTLDFDKLLLVSSPWRLFVGRVNVTSTGRDHKVLAAQDNLAQRFRLAVERGHFRQGQFCSIVLLRTSADSSLRYFLAEWTTATTVHSFTST